MSLAFHSINGYDNPNPESNDLQMFWCDFGNPAKISAMNFLGTFDPSAHYAFRNIPEIPIMYRPNFDPGDTGWLDAAGASLAHQWGISLSGTLALGTAYSGYICLNWEEQFLTNLQWADSSATNPSVGACSIQAGKLLVDVVHDIFPNALVGYYGIPIGFYWQILASDPLGAGASPHPQSLVEYQSQNDFMKQLIDYCDTVFPSPYNNYVLQGEHPVPHDSFPHGGSAVWPTHPGGITGTTGWTNGDPYNADTNSVTAQTIKPNGLERTPFSPDYHWARYQARVNEALRISDGKPVIAFVWDRLHTNTDPYGGMKQPSDGRYNKAMVEYAVRQAKYTFTNSFGVEETYRPVGYVVWDADPFYTSLGRLAFPGSFDPEQFASWIEPYAKMKYQIIHERGATAWNLAPQESTADHINRSGIESFRKFRES